MELKIFQKGFNYSQDGTGNRLVYHLCGCNMRCLWCANPEGFSEEPLLKSPDGAPYTPQAVLKEAVSCKAMFFDGGGVTFTGGEPTVQFGALKETLRLLKENGIHTALETNAAHPDLPKLFPLIDLLIMDFKHIDDEVHRQVTGISNAQTAQNIKAALAEHPNVLIRTVLVHGVNDSEACARAYAAFYKRCDTSRAAFEFLPYHEYGKQKWEKRGMPYRVENGFVTEETVAAYRRIYEENDLKVIRT
ncbi:MAG: pyruvate formate lyase-activating protein [Bacillota bacterium]|nr:MAG: pyruvate formate lyase-activating protein [Bacillota bacterium]